MSQTAAGSLGVAIPRAVGADCHAGDAFRVTAEGEQLPVDRTTA